MVEVVDLGVEGNVLEGGQEGQGVAGIGMGGQGDPGLVVDLALEMGVGAEAGADLLVAAEIVEQIVRGEMERAGK